MSTHPNVILMAVLKPDALSRLTMRNIHSKNKMEGDDVIVDGKHYHSLVMESDYQEGYQIAADEGDLVFFDMVTYGYGETVTWGKMEQQKNSLDAWAKQTSKEHNCNYTIFITANYW